MKIRKGRYPFDTISDEGYFIDLLDGFCIELGMSRTSPQLHEKFGYSLCLTHKETLIPLDTMSEIYVFSGFIDSFSKNLMVYEKKYTECGITYTYTKKDDVDYLSINFDYYRGEDNQKYDELGFIIKVEDPAPETLGDQVMTIALDRAQCYILAKEFPKALEHIIDLYKANLQNELINHNFGIIQVGKHDILDR